MTFRFLFPQRHFRLSLSIVVFIVQLTLLPSAFSQYPPQDAFLLLTRLGTMQLWWPHQERLITVDLPRFLGIETLSDFKEIVATENGIYVLDETGRVYSFLDNRRLFEIDLPQTGGVDLIADRGGEFFWLLDTQGRLYPIDEFGRIVASPLRSRRGDTTGRWRPRALTQGRQDALWVLFTGGTLLSPQLVSSMDTGLGLLGQAVNVTVNPSGDGFLVVDNTGKVHEIFPELAEPEVVLPRTVGEVAVDIELSSVIPDAFYVLDRLGAIYRSVEGTVTMVSDPASQDYCAFAVLPSNDLERLWTERFPETTVRIVPESLEVPHWMQRISYEIVCENALDWSEFSCTIAFDPEVLRSLRTLAGPVLEPAQSRAIVQDDELANQEGILEIRVSLPKRPGRGITGSGALLEVEMEPVKSGTTSLELLDFQAFSSSFAEPVPVSTLQSGSVRIYRKDPSLQLSLRPYQAKTSQEEAPGEDRVSVPEGGRIDVFVLARDVKSLKGVRYILSFNANLLELEAALEGAFLSGLPPYGTVSMNEPAETEDTGIDAERRAIAVLGRGPGANGAGTLMRYVFHCKEPGLARVDIRSATMVDQKRIRYPLRLEHSRVEIEIKSKP